MDVRDHIVGERDKTGPENDKPDLIQDKKVIPIQEHHFYKPSYSSRMLNSLRQSHPYADKD